jgi:hypothetical protein
VCSRLQSDQILSTLFIPIWLRIEDKHTPSILRLVCNIQLNHGVQVELLPEFPELLDLVHTEVVKLLLVTCVERVECLLPLRYGEDGTEESTSSKEDMLLLQLLLLLVLFPLYLLEVTDSAKFPRFH